MKKVNKSDLLIFILSAEAIGAVSALLSGSMKDFFEKYQAPPLLPPAWLFPVVWGILYALMGISAYLIFSAKPKDNGEQITKAMAVYWLQLAVNFSWSIVFFRFEALWAAVAVILLMLVLIIIMMVMFYKIRPLAAILNIPYLLWTAFASYLTIAVAVINR